MYMQGKEQETHTCILIVKMKKTPFFPWSSLYMYMQGKEQDKDKGSIRVVAL